MLTDQLSTETAESSPAQQTEVTSAETPASQVEETGASQEASPTTENEGANKQPENLLDAVRAAVKPEPASSEATPATEQGKSEAAKAADTQTTSEAKPTPDSAEQKPYDEANDAKLPFHNHPRFRGLIEERNNLRNEVAGFKDDAEQFRSISDYMTEQNLTPQEVNQGFVIMAALKNDPAQAYEMLRPVFEGLQARTGAVIPADIQRMIDEGEISESAAAQLAQSRAAATLAEESRRNAEASNTRQQAGQAYAQITAAVEGWERQTMQSDPDYSAVRDIMLDKIRISEMSKPSRTTQQAVEVAQRCLAEAKALVKRFVPAKAEVKPQPKTTQTTPQAKPQTPAPGSLAEVIRNAVKPKP